MGNYLDEKGAKHLKEKLQNWTNDNFVKYSTKNSVIVAGTSKNVSALSPTTLYVANGLIRGGTAASAGLVTRGICGVGTPNSDGSCTKDHLFINYDGNNNYSRKLVLGAGSTGDSLGTNCGYRYTAIRGDERKNYVSTQTSGKQDKLTAGTNITISGNTISSSIPLASSSARGGIQTGFSATGAKVPVQLSGEKAYTEITKGARQTAGFGEAYLSWGGKNFSGSYGPIDSARIPDLGSDRIAFAPASCWTIEYSQDSGSTWTDYGASDANKLQLTSTGATFVIGKASSSRLATEKDRLRLTLTTTGKIYSVLNKFAIYLSTNGSNGCYCTLMGRTKANLDAGTDTWVTFANKVAVSGWSGWNIINTSGITTHGNTTSQYAQIRFIFGCTSGSTKYAGLQVNKIKAFGGVGWNTPSNRAKYGTIYSYDYNQNVTFPANINAPAITKGGKAVLTTDDKTALQTSIDGKANKSHTHSISDITNLQTTLNGKADSNHTHSFSNLTDTGMVVLGRDTNLNTTDEYPRISTLSYTGHDVVRSRGSTDNINGIAVFAKVDLTADHDDLTGFPCVNGVANGKLFETYSIEAEEDKQTAYIGFARNTNTNDEIGSGQYTPYFGNLPGIGARTNKVSMGSGNTSHTLFGYIPYSKTGKNVDIDKNITELESSISEKANYSHTHTISQVSGLQTALDGKQAKGDYLALSTDFTKATNPFISVSTTLFPSTTTTVYGYNYSSLSGNIRLNQTRGLFYLQQGYTFLGTVLSGSSYGDSPYCRGIAIDDTDGTLYKVKNNYGKGLPLDYSNNRIVVSSELNGKADKTHTHAISDITNLQTTLNGKQATLVSGTNIKTINGNSILGSGDLSFAMSLAQKSLSDIRNSTSTKSCYAVVDKLLIEWGVYIGASGDTTNWTVTYPKGFYWYPVVILQTKDTNTNSSGLPYSNGAVITSYNGGTSFTFQLRRSEVCPVYWIAIGGLS